MKNFLRPVLALGVIALTAGAKLSAANAIGGGTEQETKSHPIAIQVVSAYKTFALEPTLDAVKSLSWAVKPLEGHPELILGNTSFRNAVIPQILREFAERTGPESKLTPPQQELLARTTQEHLGKLLNTPDVGALQNSARLYLTAKKAEALARNLAGSQPGSEIPDSPVTIYAVGSNVETLPPGPKYTAAEKNLVEFIQNGGQEDLAEDIQKGEKKTFKYEGSPIPILYAGIRFKIVPARDILQALIDLGAVIQNPDEIGYFLVREGGPITANKSLLEGLTTIDYEHASRLGLPPSEFPIFDILREGDTFTLMKPQPVEDAIDIAMKPQSAGGAVDTEVPVSAPEAAEVKRQFGWLDRLIGLFQSQGSKSNGVQQNGVPEALDLTEALSGQHTRMLSFDPENRQGSKNKKEKGKRFIHFEVEGEHFLIASAKVWIDVYAKAGLSSDFISDRIPYYLIHVVPGEGGKVTLDPRQGLRRQGLYPGNEQSVLINSNGPFPNLGLKIPFQVALLLGSPKTKTSPKTPDRFLVGPPR